MPRKAKMSEMDEDEDYGFEYEESDEEEEDVAMENQYYNAKGLLSDDSSTGALNGFEQVLSMEQEKGEWGFKALKQIVKLLFRDGKFALMLDRYKTMLTYIRSAVTRNYSEKCINEILDYVSSSNQMELLQEFYETTLAALQEARNERLWFKTNLKLGKLWFDLKEFGKLGKVLKELQRSCQQPDGSDDYKKGTQLLEVYALEIQMYTEMKYHKKLKQLYEKALKVKSAIPHPKIMGVIRECGGKMHMGANDFELANKDFFEAFKNYDEAGNTRRIQCLKYLVLANMMSLSEIDPFDSPEAKPYMNNPEIEAMTNLRRAYTSREVEQLERILRQNQEMIMGDSFVKRHIESLLTKFRGQVLIKLIQPYRRISIQYCAEALRIPKDAVTDLLVTLILDSQIIGRIDEVNKQLLLDDDTGNDKYEAINQWTEAISRLRRIIAGKPV